MQNDLQPFLLNRDPQQHPQLLSCLFLLF